MYRYQDVHISDLELRKQYYEAFLSGNIDNAKSIYTNNKAQLEGKVLNAENLNSLITGILDREMDYMNDVPYTMNDLFINYQVDINQLIYMKEWSSTKAYAKNNFVLYNNEIFFALEIIFPSSIPPEVNGEVRPGWLKLGLRGEKGHPTLDVNYQGEYDAGTTYKLRDMVVYENNLYVAKQAVVGEKPDTSNSWFQALKVPLTPIYVATTAPSELRVGDVWFKITS